MSSSLPAASRGVLFPGRLPARFRRLGPDAEVAELVCWWWLAEWSLPAGEASHQRLIAFPACNLAVEDRLVGFAGPTTRASSRVLEGRGWVVGALLRPASVPALTSAPAALRDRYLTLDEPRLHHAVRAAKDLESAVPIVQRWLVQRVGTVSEEARLANRMTDLAGRDDAVPTVPELARALGVSERTLHRLAERYVGLTPYALLRRRRLQEAAQQVRDQPDAGFAAIAATHGFTDQAHLAREFRQVLGQSPAQYRAQARD